MVDSEIEKIIKYGAIAHNTPVYASLLLGNDGQQHYVQLSLRWVNKLLEINKYNMTVFFVGFILVVFSLCIIFIIIKNKNLENTKYIKNTFLNIGLIILSGIAFWFYETLYTGEWSSMFMGTIVMFYILFSNIIGLIFSIIYSKKTYTTLINYGFLVISTIITYNLIGIISNLFEEINIMFSIIFYILILILVGNVFSYLIVKIIMKINNGVRDNCA